MIDQSRLRQIISLAVPIIGGMLSQNVFNLVDAAMVGRLGDAALGAVGLGSFANFVFTAPVMGLSSGVQAMAARRIGEDRREVAAVPLNGGLALATGLGLLVGLAAAAATPYFFPLLAEDPEVAELGTPYLQIRVLAAALIGCNFAFRGFLNATGRSWFYMRTLVGMHIANVFLNWVLIFGNLGAPTMGVKGAAIASLLATGVGTLLYFSIGLKSALSEGFLRGFPDGETIRTILRLSVPTGVQQFFFAAGMTTQTWIIGHISTAALAASKVMVDLLLVLILIGIAFGMAGTTMVGQALGRDDPGDARRWGWEVSWVAMVVAAVIGSVAALFPHALLAAFIPTESTIELGSSALRLVGCTAWIDVGGMVVMNCLLGAGDNRRVMMVSIVLQWFVYLPMAAVLVLQFEVGLLPLWGLQAAYRGLQTLIFMGMWKSGRWQSIQV